MHFSYSKSIKKSDFLQNSRESLELSKVLLAPFGVSQSQESSTGLIQLEECQAYYHQWEEIFSKHIYHSQHVSDDQVAASFHEYVEVNKDDEVMTLIRYASMINQRIYEIPEVTELYYENRHKHIIQNNNVCSLEFTVILLKRVLNALQVICDGLNEYLILHPPTPTNTNTNINTISIHKDDENNNKDGKDQSSSCSENSTPTPTTGTHSNHEWKFPISFDIDTHIVDIFQLYIPIRNFPVFTLFDQQMHSSSSTTSTKTSTSTTNITTSTMIDKNPSITDKRVQSNQGSNTTLSWKEKTKHGIYLLRNAFIFHVTDNDIQSIRTILFPVDSHIHVPQTHTHTSHTLHASTTTTNDTIDTNLNTTIQVTSDQYFALLDIYGNTPEIQTLLHDYFLNDTTLSNTLSNSQKEFNKLDILRIGLLSSTNTTIKDSIILSSSNDTTSTIKDNKTISKSSFKRLNMNILINQLCMDPTLQYILQLQYLESYYQQQLQYIVSNTSDNANNDSKDDDNVSGTSNTLEIQGIKSRLYHIQRALKVTQYGVKQLQKSKDLLEDDQNYKEAINLLTLALNQSILVKDSDKKEGNKKQSSHKDKSKKSKRKKQNTKKKSKKGDTTISDNDDKGDEEDDDCGKNEADEAADSEYSDYNSDIDEDEEEIDEEQEDDDIETADGDKKDMNYLPIHLKCILLIQRAKVIYELISNEELLEHQIDEIPDLHEYIQQQVHTIVNDCITVLQYDTYHIAGHIMYGKILKFIATEIQPSQGEEGVNNNRKRIELSETSIKYLLKGFLLSHCTNIEAATYSEESARELCRHEATACYQSKYIQTQEDQYILKRTANYLNIPPMKSSNTDILQLDSSSNNTSVSSNEQAVLTQSAESTSTSTTTKQIYPQEWNIKAFFMGHQLLSEAFSIDFIQCLQTYQKAKAYTTLANELFLNSQTTASDHHRLLDTLSLEKLTMLESSEAMYDIDHSDSSDNNGSSNSTNNTLYMKMMKLTPYSEPPQYFFDQCLINKSFLTATSDSSTTPYSHNHNDKQEEDLLIDDDNEKYIPIHIIHHQVMNSNSNTMTCPSTTSTPNTTSSTCTSANIIRSNNSGETSLYIPSSVSHDSIGYHIIQQLIAIIDSIWLSCHSITTADSSTSSSDKDKSSLLTRMMEGKAESVESRVHVQAMKIHLDNNDTNMQEPSTTTSTTTSSENKVNVNDSENNVMNIGILLPHKLDSLQELVEFCGPLSSESLLSSSTSHSDVLNRGYITGYGNIESVATLQSDMELLPDLQQFINLSSELLQQPTTNNLEEKKSIVNNPEFQGVIETGTTANMYSSSATTPSSSDNSENNKIKEAVQLLAIPYICQYITGVHMTIEGHILSVCDIPLLPKSPHHIDHHHDDKEGEEEEDDEVWEDCNDDDDDDASVDDDDNTANVDKDDKVTLEKYEREIHDILSTRCISYALQARLLNLCSSICYLLGDSMNAIKCLKQAQHALINQNTLKKIHLSKALYDAMCQPSLPSNPITTTNTTESSTNNTKSIPNSSRWTVVPLTNQNNNSERKSDNSVTTVYEIYGRMKNDIGCKLGSLLTDMDRNEEALDLYKKILKDDYTHLYTMIHLSEHYIQASQFEDALTQLQTVKKMIKTQYYNLYNRIGPDNSKDDNNENSNNNSNDIFHLFKSRNQYMKTVVIDTKEIQTIYDTSTTITTSSTSNNSASNIKHIQDKLAQEQMANLISTVYSLLTVTIFRMSPTTPEMALREINEGLDMYPQSTYMRLCLGEIFSQTGDAIKSIELFKKVSQSEPYHPLPYLNVARVYQQLNQKQVALIHMKYALKLDTTLTMTYVDLAQHYLHMGHTEDALSTLQGAMDLARHVSEIKDVLTARTMALLQLEVQNQQKLKFVNIEEMN